jgi:hypothetical protein
MILEMLNLGLDVVIRQLSKGLSTSGGPEGSAEQPSRFRGSITKKRKKLLLHFITLQLR